MTIDEIDDFDDDLLEDTGESYNEDYQEDTESYDYGYSDDSDFDEDDYEEEDEDIISTLLRSKGIDPESVKMENEYGELEEFKFSDLSKDEQLQLLSYNDADDDYGLSQEEIQLINQLRYNNLSPAEYNNFIARQAINGYTSQVQSESQKMQVDYISDDELYAIDLKARIPDISDEEIIEEMEMAKSNPSVYERKVNSIREEYREKEEMIQAQQQEEYKLQHQQQMAQFERVIVDSIQNNDTIDLGDSSLELSVDDKNELASFILDTDATGVRYISKALNDPNTLVKMAWYALKGEDAIRQISNYYKKQISDVSKYNYNKGYEDARSGKAANTSKSIVRKSTRQPNRPLTIDDID